MNWTALLLAGSRIGGDPVAEHCGVPVKALARVGGELMIRRVVGALANTPQIKRVMVIGEQALLAPCLEDFHTAIALSWCAPETTPAKSVSLALCRIPKSDPVLVTTSDHALLQSEWVGRFLQDSEASGADLCLALTGAQGVLETLPESKRTVLGFSDGEVCTCNLFAFCNASSRMVSDAWQSIESARKRPWRMLSRLGFVNALLYRMGRLRLEDAFGRLSRRFGVRVQPLLLPFPLLAVDVDTPEDLDQCARILRELPAR